MGAATIPALPTENEVLLALVIAGAVPDEVPEL